MSPISQGASFGSFWLLVLWREHHHHRWFCCFQSSSWSAGATFWNLQRPLLHSSAIGTRPDWRLFICGVTRLSLRRFLFSQCSVRWLVRLLLSFLDKRQAVSDRIIFHLTDTFKTLSPLAFLPFLLFYGYQPNISLSIFENVVSRVSMPIGHQLFVDGILENEGQRTSMADTSLANFVHILSLSSNLP